MVTIKEIFVPGFQKVIEAKDSETHLHSFIAIHNSTLGPALGGIRMYPYSNPEDALNDALRLAKGMTYKSAIAEDGLGGGKSVIIARPNMDKTERLLESFGEAVNILRGEYIAAEDVGTSPEDMLIIRRKTPYVVALPTERSSGDPSRFTAWGVFRGIQAVAQTLWHSKSLKKKRILIQGLGHVGSKLAGILFWEGADLILSDIDNQVLHELAYRYGAEVVSPEQAHSVECDIFTPCALGGIINEKTIDQLHCKAIAGAANNQLERPELGIALMKKGILYAPDYIINAGGIINVAVELEPHGYDPKVARDRVTHIYDRLMTLFAKAAKEKKPTSQVADEIAEYNLKHKIGARQTPVHFKEI